VAKKPQTPRPPRAVQAPKRRTSEPVKRSSPLAGMPRWGWIVAVAIVAAIAAGIFVLSSGSSKGSTANVKAAMVAAGCTYRDVPPFPPKNKTNFHADFPTLTTKPHWSTSPPSAGGHYGLWAVWGFYTDAVNPRQVVHNEEHGGVVIWWGPKVPQSTVNKLEAFYNEKPAGMFGTPYPSLGNKIALTAWTGDTARYYHTEKVKQPNGKTKTVGYYGIGHIAICPRFDEKAFATFRDAYRGKGPEGIPLSADEPGSGPG
jgi:hypothetical protein